MIGSALLMLGLGLVAASALALASKVFYVEQDPRIEVVADALPGANCGGCGQPGCSAMAEAIVKGEAPVDGCVAGGADVAAKVGEAMGVKVEFKEPAFAERYCSGNSRAVKLFKYEGATDCMSAAALFDGDSQCVLGCMGYGSCVDACGFDAIRMGDDGFPRFNPDACRGCGACVRVCPHGVIQLKTLSSYLLHLNEEDECLAPCRQKCPAQIDIPGYVEAAEEGDYEKAVRIIKDRNPLPCSCGRVCPAPCEDECRRHVIGDDAVFHNTIKRFVSDWEREQGEFIEFSTLPDTGKHVAIVGGGPAGLTTAWFLRRLGHAVTIYEMMPELGGMLRYGIPEYRLPKKILDWDIEGIIRLGVEVKKNIKIGEDVTIEELEEDYDAVVVANGAWINTTMRTEGEDLDGVWGGIHFLRQRELGKKVELGKRVAIIGGGNTAIDASRTALREGAEEVYIIYRRTMKEMPANPVEIHAAEEEGVQFMFLTAPVKIVGDENGRMTGMEVIEMELGEPDASGRRRPVPKEGSEKLLELDNVIAAIGQRVDSSFVTEKLQEKGVKLTRWNTIDGDPDTNQTGDEKLFGAGDSYTGPGLAVGAIGNGRQAARAIHMFLTGEELGVSQKTVKKPLTLSKLAELNGVEQKPRIAFNELDAAMRIKSYDEVDQTISEAQVKEEAKRCLKCGTLCYTSDNDREVM